MFYLYLYQVFMEHAKDMNLRDMLDEVAVKLSSYESERGTKQSCNYDVMWGNIFLLIFILIIPGEAFLQEIVLQPRV